MATETKADDLSGLSLTEAEAKFGPALETDTFPLAPELPEFRNDLPGLAQTSELEARAGIREVTWSLNADENRTLWFIQREGTWRYLHHKVWNKGEEF